MGSSTFMGQWGKRAGASALSLAVVAGVAFGAASLATGGTTDTTTRAGGADARWAVVAPDGTLLRDQGANKVLLGGGGYFVRFDESVKKCAYTATVGAENTAYSDPGEAQASHSTGAGNPKKDVYVALSDTDTGAISRGFSLVVNC
jgi:hypothetical protein